MITLVVSLMLAQPPQSTLPVRREPPQNTLPVRVSHAVQIPATIGSVTVFVPVGSSPPVAADGFAWVRVSCNRSGCTYKLFPTR